MSFRLFQTYKKKAPTGMISGNELALYSILRRTHDGVIKVEGRHIEWGEPVNFYDIITIKNNELESHVSYSIYDLTDYERMNASLTLRLDNVDVSDVVQYYVNA